MMALIIDTEEKWCCEWWLYELSTCEWRRLSNVLDHTFRDGVDFMCELR